MKNGPRKLAAGLLALGVMSFGIALAIELKQRADSDPIQVRYEDGQMPITKVLTDPIYNIVNVHCLNAVVTVKVVTYGGQEVSDVVKEELTEIICGTLEEYNE